MDLLHETIEVQKPAQFRQLSVADLEEVRRSNVDSAARRRLIRLEAPLTGDEFLTGNQRLNGPVIVRKTSRVLDQESLVPFPAAAPLAAGRWLL